jgi:amino acid transporter
LQDLTRGIRRWDVAGVVVNAVIGASIFGLPSTIFGMLGAYSIFAFIGCGISAAVLVFCFAEVASRYSETGGPYLYARDSFGPVTGFTVGWLVWVARVTSFAANSNLLLDYLGFFFPGFTHGALRIAVLSTVVLALGALNLAGVRSVAKASNLLAVGKLVPLLIFIGLGIVFLDPHRYSFSNPPAFQAFPQAMLLLIYAFTGFEMAVIPAGETSNPQRNIPAMLIVSMAALAVLYILIQVVCIGTLPGLALSTRPLADAASHFLGLPGVLLMTVGIVISLIGNLNILIMSASRVIFAIAEQNELPPVLAFVDRRRTPVYAIAGTLAVMLALTLSGTFIYLLTLSSVARLLTYIVTCASLPVLRRRAGAAAAAFRIPGGIALACIGIIICLWLLSATSLRAARDSIIAAAIGLLLYAATTVSGARLTGPEKQ